MSEVGMVADKPLVLDGIVDLHLLALIKYPQHEKQLRSPRALQGLLELLIIQAAHPSDNT